MSSLLPSMPAVAVSPWSPVQSNALELREGDVLETWPEDESCWWWARNENGDEGYIPNTLIEPAILRLVRVPSAPPLEELETPTENPVPSQSPLPQKPAATLRKGIRRWLLRAKRREQKYDADRLKHREDSSSPTSSSTLSCSDVTTTCCVCLQRDRAITLTPCGHSLCLVCEEQERRTPIGLSGDKLTESDENGHCPVCDRRIESLIHIY